jgi:pilus assembly protein CpaB
MPSQTITPALPTQVHDLNLTNELTMKILQLLQSNKGVVLLVAACGFGVLAIFAAKNYLNQQLAIEKARLQPKQAMVEVVVSKGELAKGSYIDQSNMAVRSIPKEYLVSGSISPERFESYLGSKISVAMRTGEPLIHQAIEGADVTTFSSKVKAGIRAMTIMVDEVNSVSGMLQPGDRIDLLLSVKPPVNTNLSNPSLPSLQAPEMTATLMQDVPVLATGKQVRPGQGDSPQARTFTTVTIEASPEAAQRLVVAQRSGKLTALLRNPGDHSPLTQGPLDIYGLLQIPISRTPIQQVLAAPEIIVGGKGVLPQALTTGQKDVK